MDLCFSFYILHGVRLNFIILMLVNFIAIPGRKCCLYVEIWFSRSKKVTVSSSWSMKNNRKRLFFNQAMKLLFSPTYVVEYSLFPYYCY